MVMRQQVWIDRHVQGVLVGRVLIYWFGIVLYFSLSTACTNWWQYPEWTLSQHIGALVEHVGPCLPTLVLLLPLVIFDIVRLSNRFAGPIFRLRNHLTQLSQNTHCPALNFRDDDYWQQLANPINVLQKKLIEQEEQLEALSFVHKSLSEAGVNLGSEPAPKTDYVSAADNLPDSTLADSASKEHGMTPIPPFPETSKPAEAFVTTAID